VGTLVDEPTQAGEALGRRRIQRVSQAVLAAGHLLAVHAQNIPNRQPDGLVRQPQEQHLGVRASLQPPDVGAAVSVLPIVLITDDPREVLLEAADLLAGANEDLTEWRFRCGPGRGLDSEDQYRSDHGAHWQPLRPDSTRLPPSQWHNRSPDSMHPLKWSRFFTHRSVSLRRTRRFRGVAARCRDLLPS
jgi:hypothetical protein